ncbi:unnamed protein product [Spirodela intermedia]|uniref:Uncharacterized protein n=1 Tax=Spirodela intermedia TaxID=51605 RepID=A0ABN7EB13_SPIIN|nr:unnamed protein product [Spirodela intermedia]
MDADSDSEAPDELTAEQAIKQDHEIRKLQIESKTREKERRRKWAQRKTQRSSSAQDVEETEGLDETEIQPGCSQATLLSTLSRVRITSREEQEMKTGNRAMNEIPTFYPSIASRNTLFFNKRR